MNESESKNEKPGKKRMFDPELLKKGLRCDLDQYDMLKRCSDKKDMTEWNEWRKANEHKDIELESAKFDKFYMEEAQFYHKLYRDIKTRVSLRKANFKHSNLKGVNFDGAELEDVVFFDSNLERANLNGAHLQRSKFIKVNLDNAIMNFAKLQNAFLLKAPMKAAKLRASNLTNANLGNSHLEGADLCDTNLEGTNLNNAFLHAAQFRIAKVNGSTKLSYCHVDCNTDFREVGLNSCIIDPGTKQLLEYNNRRMNWEEWYKEQHWSLRWLVCKFWQISDYGISTKQIIKTFFKLAFVFAIIYYIWGFIDYYLVGIKDYPGIVSDLFVLEDNQEAVSCWLVPFRAVYFSIVTMTTLGFGDMYANAHSFLRGLLGHTLLALQVILGYVLLGALVTRFAVLFTAGGPAGKFADGRKNRNKTTEKIKN